MAHFHNNALVGASGQGGYLINQSLRFNSADSAYLNRTPASAGNQKTWTYSVWIKRSLLSSNIGIFMPVTGGDGFNECQMRFDSNDRLQVYDSGGSAGYLNVVTTRVFRDCSAWYHLVFVYDSTQATSSNRFKIYVNGVQETNLSTAQYPNQNNNSGWNGTSRHDIGRIAYASNQYFGGYMAECYMVDGTALTPPSFGETDTITGAWIPKKYSGSFGTNGFYLKFESSGIGTDSSGNGNTWTASGFSTSGTGTDVMSDTPTNNWTTLNPITPSIGSSLSDGNLVGSYSSSSGTRTYGTTALPATGKFYFECTITGGASQTAPDRSHNFGLLPLEQTSFVSNGIGWFSQGTILLRKGDNTGTSGSSGFANNDVLQCAVDCATGKVWMGLNNSWYSTASSTTGDPAAGTNESATFQANTTYFPFGAIGCDAGVTGTLTFNFGQRAFAYTPPTGYKALNTANLPEPTIKKGGAYFNTVLYTGTGTTNAITGVGFQPDFVWGKRRNDTGNNWIFDAVRGAGNQIVTNNTNAEVTGSTEFASFDSNGFTVTSTAGSFNASSSTYVAWNWKANGAGSSNTAGSITSTVSANASAGFSIVTYTGNGSTATVGHGLGVAPRLVIVKKRAGGTMGGGYSDWLVYSQAAVDAGAGSDAFYYLNSTAGTSNSSSVFSGAPSSTVINIGNNQIINNSGSTFVAYCFSEVAGYSKFGSYTGNGSSDGPFVYCGFRPAWVMIKVTNEVTTSWMMRDTARNPYNIATGYLFPNSSSAEFTNLDFDIYSNGFKPRNTNNVENASGKNYIFAAFAELPFKYSTAR